MAIMSKSKHGGKRPGAGRKRKHPPKPPDPRDAITAIIFDEFGDPIRVKTDEEVVAGAAEYGMTPFEIAEVFGEKNRTVGYKRLAEQIAKKNQVGLYLGIQSGPQLGNQVGPPILNKSPCHGSLFPMPGGGGVISIATRAALRAAPGENFSKPGGEEDVTLGKSKDGSPLSKNPTIEDLLSSAIKPLAGDVKDRGDMGLMIGDPDSPSYRPPIEGTMGQPRRPDYNVVPPVIVPPPPQLPADVKGLDAAEWLLKAYRGAFEAKYKRRCHVLTRRGQLAKSKHAEKLAQAAELLREHEVAPASWARWSMDVWEEHCDSKGRPPLSWVFGIGRIEERLDWFFREAESYECRRAIYVEPAKELMTRYECMRQRLVQVRARSEEEVRAVVDEWFPGDTYVQLVRAARNKAVRDQEIIADLIRRGEWVWR